MQVNVNLPIASNVREGRRKVPALTANMANLEKAKDLGVNIQAAIRRVQIFLEIEVDNSRVIKKEFYDFFESVRSGFESCIYYWERIEEKLTADWAQDEDNGSLLQIAEISSQIVNQIREMKGFVDTIFEYLDDGNTSQLSLSNSEEWKAAVKRIKLAMGHFLSHLKKARQEQELPDEELLDDVKLPHRWS